VSVYICACMAVHLSLYTIAVFTALYEILENKFIHIKRPNSPRAANNDI